MQPEYQRDPNALAMLYVRSNNGKLVPLSAIANITQTVALLTVNHLAQLPSATISFDTLPEVSLSQATAAIQKLAEEIL
ncbi:efflux RND transporter permease subunit, partial [Dolichospermum sp. UHCC 0260]|uniref:efflux RND transporter permease subunit n=1 Tax=Dolichospermum sp. UHCC 0260 TaxID=2590025 RepID=UPI00158109FE